MSVPASLLDINVDELFEQHGIADIDQIHKKLQTDVEHKKEELRTMVGERYRDLLKAADTIGEMRTTATAVVAHIDDITATCRRLNEQQLIGFRNAGGTPTHHHHNSATKPYSTHNAAAPPTAAERALHQFHGLGVQIKLLVALPGLISLYLDADEFHYATQLFALSRHISTGLQLDVHRPLMRHFPVARQLWATLSPCYHTIRRACLAALAAQTLPTATATKCLASLLVLESCTAERLLATLLQLRSKAFRAALTDEVGGGGSGVGGGQRIQDTVLDSVRVLHSTMQLVHECFVAGALREEVDRVQTCGSGSIELMRLTDAAFVQKVPEIIATFRPRIQLTDLPADTVRAALTAWPHTTATECHRLMQSVIDGIASVHTIHRIRERVPSTIVSPPYADCDVYTLHYQPLINERVKQIIRRSWADIVQRTQRDVEQLALAENRTDADAKAAATTAAAKWTPLAADVPLSLKQALSTTKQCHRLAMRSRGYTPAIVAVCAQLDEQLATICGDVALYVGEQQQERPRGDDELTAIVGYLKETSREAVGELITGMKSTSGYRSKSTCIALATLLTAIVELCPNLKRCLVQQGTTTGGGVALPAWTALSTPLSPLTEWDQVCGLLADESFRFWSEWIEMFVGEQAALFPAEVAVDYQHIAGDQLTWETFAVEEKDEHDQPIESAIRVPAHVSVTLQRFWHHVCTELQRTVVPFVLPRNVTVALSRRLTAHLAEVFAARAGQKFVADSQTASLQCYFDVRFVQLVFVGRECRMAAEEWQALAAKFKANIDPFDFELFHKYLGANVKKAAQRMQHKLGVLIANADQLASVLAASVPAASAQDKEPNVLTLSTRTESAGYFALLPVISIPTGSSSSSSLAPKTSAAKSEQSNAKPKRARGHATTTGAAAAAAAQSASSSATSAAPSQPANLANVKSGAAAFFGAMSKDWFQ